MENIKLSKVVKILLGATLIEIILIFASPVLLSLTIRYFPYNFQPSLYQTEQISDDGQMVQEIISQKEGLTGMGLSIKNPNLKNKENLTLSLYEEGSLLRQTTISGKVIPDGDLIKFVFSPIEYSLGKTYEFTLSAPRDKEGNTFTVYTTDEKNSWTGSLYIGSNKNGLPLSFVTYYRPKNKIETAISVYQSAISRFFQDKAFAYLYILILSVVLVWYLRVDK